VQPYPFALVVSGEAPCHHPDRLP